MTGQGKKPPPTRRPAGLPPVIEAKFTYLLDEEACAVLASVGSNHPWFIALRKVMDGMEKTAMNAVALPSLPEHEGTFQRGRAAGFMEVAMVLDKIVNSKRKIQEIVEHKKAPTGYTDRKGNIVSNEQSTESKEATGH